MGNQGDGHAILLKILAIISISNYIEHRDNPRGLNLLNQGCVTLMVLAAKILLLHAKCLTEVGCHTGNLNAGLVRVNPNAGARSH